MTKFNFSTNLSLKPWIYHFECTSCEFTISSKGDPMVVLGIKVFSDKPGIAFTNKVYITPPMNYLLKHFWDSVGVPEKFTPDLDNAEFDTDDFIGKCGLCKTGLEPSQKNPEMKFVKVLDFMTIEKANYWKEKESAKLRKSQEVIAPIDDLKDDDVPF